MDIITIVMPLVTAIAIILIPVMAMVVLHTEAMAMPTTAMEVSDPMAIPTDQGARLSRCPHWYFTLNSPMGSASHAFVIRVIV